MTNIGVPMSSWIKVFVLKGNDLYNNFAPSLGVQRQKFCGIKYGVFKFLWDPVKEIGMTGQESL